MKIAAKTSQKLPTKQLIVFAQQTEDLVMACQAFIELGNRYYVGTNTEPQDQVRALSYLKQGRELYKTCSRHEVEEAARKKSRSVAKELRTLVKIGTRDQLAAFFNDHHTVDVNEAYGNRKTALHWATRKGNMATMAFLIENRAHVDAQDSKGMTPAHYAAEDGPENALQMLIEAHASMNVSDCMSMRPIDYAILNGHEDLVRFFIKHNLHGGMRKDGKTALHFAALRGTKEVIALLITEGGFDPNVCDAHGVTPLGYAVKSGNTSHVRELLLRGASTDIGYPRAVGGARYYEQLETIAAKRRYFMIAEMLKMHRRTKRDNNALADIMPPEQSESPEPTILEL